MSEWEQLEQLMPEEERQQLVEWMKQQALINIVKGTAQPRTELLKSLDWQEDCYQVVYSRSFNSAQAGLRFQLKDLLFFGMHENRLSFSFPEGEGEILILRGKAAVERLNIFIEHYLTTPPQKNSPMYSLFFTCGCVVHDLRELHQSYEIAAELMGLRFFAEREQHMMDADELKRLRGQEESHLQEEDAGNFCKALVDSIQTFNKSLLDRQIRLLYEYLQKSHETPQKLRMFLMEIYIQTRGKLREKYPVVESYTEGSRKVFLSIWGKDYLYEILDSIAQELDALMHVIGTPSRDSVLNDILFYIQHNIDEQLKLETIAPLFGYNSAYLGKIFRQNVGESFNTYVDRIRIERAKELLRQEKMKVYEIAERVGYRSVDYFHKKFLKNVGMSPAAYRRRVLDAAKEQPDGGFYGKTDI